MNDHCWHETGYSSTTMVIKSVKVICCHCGLMRGRTYKAESEPLEGHGKFWAPEVFVPQVIDCDKECTSDD